MLLQFPEVPMHSSPFPPPLVSCIIFILEHVTLPYHLFALFSSFSLSSTVKYIQGSVHFYAEAFQIICYLDEAHFPVDYSGKSHEINIPSSCIFIIVWLTLYSGNIDTKSLAYMCFSWNVL